MNLGKQLAFPFGIGSDGRSLTADTLDAQVLAELEQLVLTNPGERPFLPTFGGGASRLLFETADGNAALLAKSTLTQAIQNWLAGRAVLQGVDVSVSGSAIIITITYQIAGSTASVQALFQRTGP
jgi:uncharacterized protein